MTEGSRLDPVRLHVEPLSGEDASEDEWEYANDKQPCCTATWEIINSFRTKYPRVWIALGLLIKSYVAGLVIILLVFTTAGQAEEYMNSPTVWASWFLVPFLLGLELVGVMELAGHFVVPSMTTSEPWRLVAQANRNGGRFGINTKHLFFVVKCGYFATYYFTFFLIYVFGTWDPDIETEEDHRRLPIASILWWYMGPQFFMSFFIFLGGTLFLVCLFVLWLEIVNMIKMYQRRRARRARMAERARIREVRAQARRERRERRRQQRQLLAEQEAEQQQQETEAQPGPHPDSQLQSTANDATTEAPAERPRPTPQENEPASQDDESGVDV